MVFALPVQAIPIPNTIMHIQTGNH